MSYAYWNYIRNLLTRQAILKYQQEEILLEGDDKMPWYMNPVETRKVLNRIANRYQCTQLQDLRAILDQATQLIWTKQENYYQNRR